MTKHPGNLSERGCGSIPSALRDPKALESELRDAVAKRVGEQRFGVWFGDGVGLGLSGDGESMEVRVPDEFFRERIRGNFAGSLVEAAEAVTGRPMRLLFSIRHELEPGVGDVVLPGEERPDPRPGVTVTVPIPINPKAPSSSPQGRPLGPDRAFPSRPEPGSSVLSNPWIQPQARRPGSTTSAPQSPGRPVRRLEDFITGSCNQLAHAAAREMVHNAGTVFNPLLVYAGVGLGKTHLLEGIAQGLRQARPGLNLLHCTAETFTNAFLEAMRTGTLASFRTRFRGIESLVIDDIHFLAAKRATQDEFLHTFNALVEKGAPIVLSADQHPRRITRLPDELVTRFLGGMVVKLEAPDLATRRGILLAKSAARGVNIPSAVLDYIAEHLRSSVRELEGALHSVIAHALLTGKRLDLALARTALRDTIRHTAQSVGLRDVERVVCELFQMDADTLKSASRARASSHPRMLAMFLARKHTGAAYTEIGRHFGGRNHSTVISAEKKVAGWLRDEQRNGLLPGFESLADVLADLERSLGA